MIMKKLALVFALAFTGTLSAQMQPAVAKKDAPEAQIVEAGCGLCRFGMEGKDCRLAVRIGDKPYWVSGSSIDDHGDAHAANGLCMTSRKAEVIGEISGDSFKATSFKLL